MKPFQAKLCVGDRELGEIRGEIDEAGGEDGSRRGHFEWPGALGLLSGAADLRLEFSGTGEDATLFIDAQPRTADLDAQPPYPVDFRSTDGPTRVVDERGKGDLPHTMQ